MIGRVEEIAIMHKLLNSKEPELLAFTGRRRVGKTYLIKEVYKENMVFDFTGTRLANRKNQLEKFAEKFAKYRPEYLNIQPPETWGKAFKLLTTYLNGLRKSSKKRVVFFDEVPWIAQRRSGFLDELSYWWNNWASTQSNLIVVICGSAASWMIQKVINDKGGLHNRVTKRIHLEPFTLAETKAFLNSRGIKTNNMELIKLYMCIGGIPHYLKEVENETAATTVNRICFKQKGSLRTEFDNLYAALFDNYQNHITVVRALANKWCGMTRNEVAAEAKLAPGGGLTRTLEELVASSFIMQIPHASNRKKEMVYRLADEYTMFYFKFMEGVKAGNQNIWLQQQTTDNKVAIWQGYAFENLCIKHVEAIKTELGINGIHTNTYSVVYKKSQLYQGVQIDMIIDRSDNAMNLCEMKFYNTDVYVTEEMAAQLRRRREVIRQKLQTKKVLFNTLVTTYGAIKNEHFLSQVDQVITADCLFKLPRFD